MTGSKLNWIDEYKSELKGKILATLSMEGYIPELSGDAREANARGGLGIYFGDKLEGLQAIGMDNAFGCMPLYKKRLVQTIRYGKQNIEYKEVSYEGQPIEPVTDHHGKSLHLDIWGWDRNNTAIDLQYNVTVYSINRGGIQLYLFYCPDVFDVLYPDDKTHQGHGREHRFLQETVFAECAYQLLKALAIVPDILHLNEGHVAGAAAIIKGDSAFEKTAVVYTNHTVVPAGLERFSIDRLTGGDISRARYAMRFPWPNHHRFWKKFSVQLEGRWFIDFSKGALELCDIANGVSNEHVQAMQSLFPAYDRGMEAALNGSGDTWVAEAIRQLQITGKEIDINTLNNITQEAKDLSLAEVKKRTIGMTNRAGKIIYQKGLTLNHDLPTVWMVRRMVFYKSQLPILKNIINVVCANRDELIDTPWGKMNGLQMQVIVGGIAPEGSNEEQWIEEFVDWMQNPELKGRFVFVPNADTILLKMQAIGADICINCPLPEHEACGTSDQRSARNGGINIATQSGGPPEYITDGKNGMLVGPYPSNEDFYKQAPRDIMDKLRQLSDMYFSRQTNNAWLDMKLESFKDSSKVTATAMEQRYAEIYIKAINFRKNVINRVGKIHYKEPYSDLLSNLILRLDDASNDFLYRDPILKNWTIIAGSPYFDQRQGSQLYNWGRDAMIALPGLCLNRERYDTFRHIIKNYMRFVKHGILPNLIGDGSKPRYNSVDASMWLFWAIGKYLEFTKDYSILDIEVKRVLANNRVDTIQIILEEIIETYKNGIFYEDCWQENGIEQSQTVHIFMDTDFLISAGNESTQLTWMDVKPIGHKPVTSRHGKAVEINALWYNALIVMKNIKRHKNSTSSEYLELAEKVKSSFIKFWNQKEGCLYDTVDGDPVQGKKVRPNQIFAVSFGLLDKDKSRKIMGKLRCELLTPFGLRTLSPRDPDYHPFHNDQYSYHQGTIWPWLTGAFIEASLAIYGKRVTLKILDGIGYFNALSSTLERFGSIPEVFDGCSDSDYQHSIGKGCIAQAWNVAETLRCLSQLISENDLINTNQQANGSKIIYEMVIRDYYDNVKDIPGLIVALHELTFLEEVGVEYIYLLGLMRHDGNPFNIINPIDIDPRAGTFEDLNYFIMKAHSLGLKIIVDWMANQHVSKNSPLCQTHPDWFLYTDAPNGEYFAGQGMKLYQGKNITNITKDLVLVSATDEVPLRSFPRRWNSLAQPDLSHPAVREHALEIGHFWLSKGFDGFRIDAALSAFPDKIKENWGQNVEENLTNTFIEEMRRIKSDCFIMFEGFERLNDLLQLADYENCAVYNWKSRNLATDSLNDPNKIPSFIDYLKELEHKQHIRDDFVNIGPEHDAYDFEDPWAKLDYTGRLMLHFLYTFLPGYMLVFNGQIFGKQHVYKKQLEKTLPTPRITETDIKTREIAKKLFGLRKEFPQLIKGNYQFLQNGDQHLIHLARFDENIIVIGILNTNQNRKNAVLSLNEIIKKQKNQFVKEHDYYMQEVLTLEHNSEVWIDEAPQKVLAEELLHEGLHVRISPMSFQGIKLSLNT
jgi:glycogen debranching enzyme/glucan phosphorylase/glycosidase